MNYITLVFFASQHLREDVENNNQIWLLPVAGMFTYLQN